MAGRCPLRCSLFTAIWKLRHLNTSVTTTPSHAGAQVQRLDASEYYAKFCSK